MKIPPTVQALSSVYGVSQLNSGAGPAKARRDQATAQSASAGHYEISQEAQSFQSVLRRVREQSDVVRMDKVQALQQQIDAGAYRVDDDTLAAAIIGMRF